VNWLHWIEKQYYTMDSFMKEARKYDFSRPISPKQLQQMSWGDAIYCAMLDGKTGVIFGYFKVLIITGLDPETLAQVGEKYVVQLIDNGGDTVSRSCGEYTTGATYSINANIEEIANDVMNVENEKENKSKLMIGGHFNILVPIRILDIPFCQGFRPIDIMSLRHDARENDMKVYGQYYLPQLP